MLYKTQVFLGVRSKVEHASSATFTLKGNTGLVIFFNSWYGAMVIYSLRAGEERSVQKIYDSGNAAMNNLSVVWNGEKSFSHSGLDVGKIIFD